ncbi:NAD(P)H-binding protein [Microbacterium luticocti]|uniref:NmrA family NAD(P)-binding protein n=1 Tax=Microbacterium luticocti TaxID=451764 RepID=UPI00040E4D71|nr:NAD(P)H-binding protein [Microbacterium luticocti]
MPALILGATGNVGPHVVRELQVQGEHPRVMVRDADRAHALLGDDVDVHAGDMTDPAALAAAADGVDTVFLLSPHGFSMGDAQLGVIRALRRTGIRIVKLSGTSSAITPDGPHACRQHWEVERILQESGQPFVILRPNSFLQVLVERLMLPGLNATGTIMNPLGDAGISLIDARDVGAVAAATILRHDWDGQTLVLTGPRAVTYAEIADLVAARTGRPAGLAQVTPADVRASLVARGTEEWEAEHFEEMYALFRAGESAFVTDTVEQVTGRAPRTIEAFLDEVLAPAEAAS